MRNMFSKLFAILVIFAFSIACAEAKQILSLTDASADCAHELPDLIASYECFFTRKNNIYYGNGHIRFKRPIEQLKIQTIVSHTSFNLPKMDIMNFHIELCDFLEKSQKERYLDFLANFMRKYVNEIPRCPLRPNFTYAMTEARVNIEDFPIQIPFGNFSVTIYLYNQNRRSGHVILKGSLMRKNGATEKQPRRREGRYE